MAKGRKKINDITICLGLSNDLAKAIEIASAKKGLPRNTFIKLVLMDYFEKNR